VAPYPNPPQLFGMSDSFLILKSLRALNSISWEELDSPNSLSWQQENQEAAQEGITQKQIKLAMKFAHVIRKPVDFPLN